MRAVGASTRIAFETRGNERTTARHVTTVHLILKNLILYKPVYRTVETVNLQSGLCTVKLRWSHFVGQFGGSAKVYSGI